jgi:5-methylcytosine-specific restriction endonuclease McrA
MPLDGDAMPLPKEAQLARGDRRPKRVRASKARWEQIAEKKQGPCRVCQGRPPNQLHHLVPRSQGGSDTEANIVPLCADCHRRVTGYDRAACALLRVSLTDLEYAYATETLGEGRFEARYPVAYERT